MPQRLLSLYFVFLSFLPMIFCQVSGIVTDQNGQPLSFVTVYIEGTSNGTVANLNGAYNLNLPSKGSYNIVFQYIGYQTTFKKIDYLGKTISLNVFMTEENYALDEVVIASGGEDPAYPIIRNAIKKREYHRNQSKTVQADLYVKGKINLTQAPKKVMGQDIGNLGGILDTSRQGILYLAETKSKYYHQMPDKTKEVVVSSVTSGENSIFTANRFQMFQFNVYDEYNKFVRTIPSPIADNATNYYRFKLEYSKYNEQGEKIYKIKVIPKSDSEPLMSGDIFIVDGYFNVQNLDATISGGALRGTFMDTVVFKQVFVPVGDRSQRKLLSQVVYFKGGVFGFRFGGAFTYIFSNYILDQNVNHIFSNNETFSVQFTALNKDTAFWASARPVPLTPDESRDYVRKDSLAVIWKSPRFLDSMDREQNKFSFMKLLLGYTYSNSQNETQISFPKLGEWANFDPVAGWNISPSVGYMREDSLMREWSWKVKANYGFSDRQLKPFLAVKRRYDNYNQAEIYGGIGRRYEQFDTELPINLLANQINNLFLKINRLRIFDLREAYVGWKREVKNGLFVEVNSRYVQRDTLTNTTEYSFYRKGRDYSTNHPNSVIDATFFRPNMYWITDINWVIRPYQKYSSFPNMKLREPSDWPVITLNTKLGVGVTSGAHTWLNFKLGVHDNNVDAHRWGRTRYRLNAGAFAVNKPMFFGDFYHPSANQLLFPLTDKHLSFNLMPFYAYSTDKPYAELFWKHHFDGKFIDKIPLLNKTSIKETIAFSTHYNPTKGHYTELTIGLENFKFRVFRLFDIEYSWSFKDGKYYDQGFVVRIERSLFARD